VRGVTLDVALEEDDPMASADQRRAQAAPEGRVPVAQEELIASPKITSFTR
jgi:hypothetical protein